MSLALKIQQLTKRYANGYQALSQIDLEITLGDFFALLGANGAGKTTTIHIICGLLQKSGGDISVLGVNQAAKPEKVKSLIGLMGQEFNFSLFEPIEEVLINQAGYYGINRKAAKQEAHILLKKLSLWDKRKQIVETLSGGMKRRLMLARALIHRPKILILDEPTAGVDIEIRRDMWAFLRALNQSGMTIILTTHYLEEAEQLCKNIAIIDQGRVLLQSTMKDLLRKTSGQVLQLESINILPEGLNLAGFITKKIDDFSLQVQLSKEQTINELLGALNTQNIQIRTLTQNQNKLEALFIQLTQNSTHHLSGAR